ncbi:MAG: triose-phosphate isomerase family protein [bacterium]
MKNNKLLIANWKINMSFEQTINYITSNYDELINLPIKTKTKIILCPSAIELYTAKQILKDTPIYIGAQNCSKYLRGAFTGEISVINLNNIGCQYCIIGHSERRINYHETNTDIVQKLENLIDYSISPIICIGENKNDYENKKTIPILEKQLQPILDKIKIISTLPEYLEICIAYEPVWSIGTGQIAEIPHLETIFSWLNETIQKISSVINFKLIYGGSVDPESIKILSKIEGIDGFLIGGSSCNFQDFEKIVNLVGNN